MKKIIFLYVLMLLYSFAADINKIESIIKNVGNYEVTIWDTSGNLAKKDTYSKVEVIINATYVASGDIDSFKKAKFKMYEIMKNIFENPKISGQVVRVLFNSHYLKCSLGATDANNLPWIGPTNFWTVMMKYKPFMDESGSLASRTWGVRINR
ncbi:MAG: hypothetical protein A2Y40_01515 [Candidatus Margulisbacteria bacterium GWF2_35_9]|nr:MAG: hypothetical protein A2Y40_01515 [Candidatus Margulisbacteria bacterium GWF2_35_9]